MNFDDVKQILSEAEVLAYKIANRKSVLFTEGRPGEFFNSNNRDMQTIWKDVVIAYKHFKAIDLNDLVRVYNEPRSEPKWLDAKELFGYEWRAVHCDKCPDPSHNTLCKLLSIKHSLNTNCEYCGRFDGSNIECKYKEES